MTPSAPQSVRLDQLLLASRLVSEVQLRECRAVAGADFTPEHLAADLIRRGWLTHWQLQQLARGQTAFFVDQDRYLLLSLIGQGGMGSVYKARHTRMGREVALKVINPKRVADQSVIQRFRREVEVCSRLQHEHIVQAFDVGEHAGATFLVLEFMEGSDLASLVKRDGPMQPEEAAAICLQAAAGLAYAHSLGIVHRDIKPQNILLSTSGVVKILDMGLARILDDGTSDPHTSLTQEGAVMGTVDYMPPEQARETKSADARSDIYSLGGTLYYLLAGQPPFAGGSMIEKMQRLANETPPPLCEIRIDCPRALDDVVQKMLAKRPEDRYQTAGDVVRALKPLAAERIAGRAAVTAAVQSAADTLHAAGDANTDAAMITFATTDDSFAATKSRLHSQRSSPRKIAAGVAIAAALLTFIVIWGIAGKEKRGEKVGVTGNEKTSPNRVAAGLPPERIVRELPGHFGGPTSPAWAPDGVHLAVGSLDGEIHIRAMGFPEALVRYAKHRSSVVGVIWLPKGDLIASTEAAGDIHVWHAFTGQTRHTIQRNRIDVSHTGVASNGGTGLACSAAGSELVYSNGGTIVRLSVPAFEPLGTLPLEGQTWHDFRYSPSGRLLATSWYQYRRESGITVTDLQAENTVLKIKGTVSDSFVESVAGAFPSDEELAVIRPQRLEVWNIAAGKMVREFPINTGDLTFPQDWSEAAGFIADSSRLALWSGDGGLDLISTQDGTSRHISVPPQFINLFLGRHWDFTKDLRQLALFPADAPSLAIVRLADGRRESPWGDEWFGMWHTEPPSIHGDMLLRFSPAQTWDLRTGRMRDDLANKFFTVSPAGSLWIVERDRVRTQAIEGAKSEDILREIVLEDSSPENLPYSFWSGDRRRLFQWRADTLHVWETETGRKVAAFRPAGAPHHCQVSYDGKSVSCSPNVAGAPVYLYREPYDQPHQTVPAATPGPVPVSISSRTRFLAYWPGVIYRTDNGRRFETENLGFTSGGSVWNGAFSRTGEYLLVDHSIWRLSGQAPEQIWTSPDEPHAVHTLHNTPSFIANCWFDDEEHVALTQDASVGIWRWRENRKRATLYFLPEENWAFVNHETQYWNGSPGADLYLRYERRAGDKTLRLKPADDRKQFGWKNDPKQAGLDLDQRNSVTEE